MLPVSLLEFKAKLVANSVKLNWSTAHEINNSGFAVERSLDGVHFAQISWVSAKESVQGKSIYEFTDVDVKAGNKYYYRLKQQDKDGKYAYSSIVTVSYIDNHKGFSVFPNPINDKLTILSSGANTQKAEIVVSDASGKAIYQNTSTITGQLIIETANWTKGVYFVKINTTDGEASTLKVVKQ